VCAVGERRLDEAEVEADRVTDDLRVADEREASLAASAGLGAFLTSASLMPCIWLPMIGRPGLTSVDHRSVIFPPLTLTAAISTRSAIFGSVPVVSTSTMTNSSPFSTPLAKSRTVPVPARGTA
jgi:hypothetical protein